MSPQLDLALYSFGKSGLPSKGGYIRQIVPFTNDLDKISKELFALKTSGGSEYCGWVIKNAVNQLKWSKAPDDLKVVFIAGNEAFTQGPIDYKESCKAAIKKGIIVNTIHCGSMSAGISGKWKDGAMLSDGKYLCINHNQRAVEIAAPQDAELVKLNSELNGTYIAYGVKGRQLKQNQIAQDMNSSSISSSNMASRVATKSSKFYYNGSWDIVDALEADKIDLGKMKKKDLPKEMREMDEEERNEYVVENAKKRKELQAKIQKLNDARKSYIAKEMKKRTGEDSSLGAAIIKAVRKQAEKRSFIFEEAKKEEKPEK